MDSPYWQRGVLVPVADVEGRIFFQTAPFSSWGARALEGYGVKRFDRLEFDAPQERPQPGAGGRVPEDLHDEHHWLKQADAERREGYFENALRYYSRALELNKSLVTGWRARCRC